MDQDAAWTRLFGQPVFVEHLIRLALPGLARWLDWTTLDEVPTRWAVADAPGDAGLRAIGGYSARTGDRAWRVGYGDDSGRSLLMPTEFQSDTDVDMDLRSRQYGLLGYQAVRKRQPDRDGSVRMVPVVIYSGGARWAVSYPAWAQPRANVTAKGEPWLQARAACVLLDADSCERDDFAAPNLVRELLRMNARTRLEDTVDVLTGMAQWLREALVQDRAALVIHELVDWWAVCAKHALTPQQVAQVRQSLVQGRNDEMMALARTAREWPRIWREEGRQEGRREGKVEGLEEGHRNGQVELLRGQAARKFGVATATTLVQRLEQVEDADAIVEAGQWVMECDSAAELLRRLDGLREGR